MARTIPLVALLCALAAIAAGCGSSSHRPVDPEATLDAAFAHPVASADVEADLTVQVEGADRLRSPIRLKVDGPYVSGGASRFPSFEWRASASALGFPVGGHVTSTGDNVYLSLYGDDYQLGEAPPPLPGIDPRPWFGPARDVGDGNEGGVDCARIRAPLRGGRVASDLETLLARIGSSGPIGVRGTAEACVGFDDHLLHELKVDAHLAFPVQGRAALAGATGAHLIADVALSDVGQPQRIVAPAGGNGYRPVSDLLLSLQDLGVPVP